MGGQGSGRIANPVNRLAELKTPIANAQGDSLFIPNVSSIKRPITLVSGAVLFADSYGRVNGDISKIFINPAGSVGIGTDTPNHLLNIYSSTFNNSVIGLYNSFNQAANRNWAIALNQTEYGDFHIMQSNAQDGNPISAGISRFVIENTGNVGIGLNSPSAKLEISGNQIINGASTGTTTYLQFKNNGTAISLLGSDASISAGTATDVGLFVYGNNNLDFWTDSNRVMRIAGSGKVGIGTGTTAPAEKLTVSGGSIQMTNNYYLKWYDSTGTARNVLYYDSADNVYLSGRPGATDVYVGLGNGIVAKSTGSVGIGTATPDVRLTVNGCLSLSNQAAPTLTNTASSGAIFVSGGALYFKGASGTQTKLANA